MDRSKLDIDTTCDIKFQTPLFVGSDAQVWLRALVHLAIARRRHTHAATQVVAQVATRSETCLPGDLVDGQIARLQQFAGAVDAAAAHPRTRRLPRLLTESTVEGARAHLRVPRQPLHRELFIEVLQRPLPCPRR